MSNLLEALLDTNINASKYRRGPLGKGHFAAGIRRVNPEGEIKIWEGTNSEIEVATSDKYRQAVVNILEPTRRIELNVECMVSSRTEKVSDATKEKQMLDKNKFKVLARGARAKIIEIDKEPTSSLGPSGTFGYGHEYWSHTFRGKIRWTIPSSKQTMLMGMDETYHFIAALREPAKSVSEAHKILRPEGVPKNALRQGEWFFVSISRKLQEELDAYVEEKYSRLFHDDNLGSVYSSHRATQKLSYNRKTYAIGYVVDSREGHHSPIWLPEWHEVVRNREIVQASSSVYRYWD